MRTLYMLHLGGAATARRLPLRQTGPSLHPGEACLFGEEQKRMTRRDEGAGLSGVTRYAVRSSVTLG